MYDLLVACGWLNGSATDQAGAAAAAQKALADAQAREAVKAQEDLEDGMDG